MMVTKKIYIVWFQGFNNAPYIVNKCLESWYYYNSDWEIVKIDNNNLHKYITLPNIIKKNKNISLNVLSDVIRLLLLQKYGGIWVDATLFCNRRLNEWIYNYISENIFAFKNTVDDILIASWFIYAEKDNYIINMLCNRMIKYIENNQSYPYFIFHYLFNELYNQDGKIKNIFDNIPKLAADGITGPFYIQQQGMFNNINERVSNNIKSKVIPVYKLTYKTDFALNHEKTILNYLLSSI